MKLVDLLPCSSLVICAKCGSINVQIMDWVEPNSEKFIGGAGDPDELDTYCEDCEDNEGIISICISGLTETEVELEITKAIMPPNFHRRHAAIPNDSRS